LPTDGVSVKEELHAALPQIAEVCADFVVFGISTTNGHEFMGGIMELEFCGHVWMAMPSPRLGQGGRRKRHAGGMCSPFAPAWVVAKWVRFPLGRLEKIAESSVFIRECSFYKMGSFGNICVL